MNPIRSESILIDGVWRAASDGGTLDVENPADLSIVATVPVATAKDLDDALAAAERAREPWARTPAWERSDLLRAAAALITERTEHIAALLTAEQGKPLRESRAEVRSAAEQFEWYADEARRIYGRIVEGTTAGTRIEVRKEPIGPVAAFTPGTSRSCSPPASSLLPSPQGARSSSSRPRKPRPRAWRWSAPSRTRGCRRESSPLSRATPRRSASTSSPLRRSARCRSPARYVSGSTSWDSPRGTWPPSPSSSADTVRSSSATTSTSPQSPGCAP
ncbi:aldehyde dehydrogenase family protein [Microbacterium sp. Se5.02b]|nr:aldehyde dehydrogenase family protein [Microbacterium sp. Se5.02b]